MSLLIDNIFQSDIKQCVIIPQFEYDISTSDENIKKCNNYLNSKFKIDVMNNRPHMLKYYLDLYYEYDQ